MKGITGREETIINKEGGKQSAVGYRMDLIPPEAWFAMGAAMKEGVDKGREKDNWKKIGVEDHVNHAMGHIAAFLMGMTNEDHIGHAMARLAMAVALSPFPQNLSSPEPEAPKSCTWAEANEKVVPEQTRPVVRVYVCAPLAGNIRVNKETAVMAGRKIMKILRERGVIPVMWVPHAALCGLTFGEMDGETERELGMRICLEMVRWCDRLYVIGKKITKGMTEEIELAQKENKEIFYWEEW